MSQNRTFLVALATVFTVAGDSLTVCGGENDLPDRSITLVTECTITGLTPNTALQVWCPEPASSTLQSVTLQDRQTPTVTQRTEDKRYGNSIRYFKVDATTDSTLSFRYEYQILRRGLTSSDAIRHPNAHSAAADISWLEPNRLVPVNPSRLQQLWPEKLAGNATSRARQIYDRVLSHVDYRKDKPGYGRGDTLWVCDSRFGNCTDFHSLFISQARSEGIPALFEIGLPLPTTRQIDHGAIGGYHCWAWFRTEAGGWVPVDISEADKHPEQTDFFFGNLPANRVALSVGRDIVLEPPQSGPPLNYFVYPYCEVDGGALPPGQITTRYSWRSAAAD